MNLALLANWKKNGLMEDGDDGAHIWSAYAKKYFSGEVRTFLYDMLYETPEEMDKRFRAAGYERAKFLSRHGFDKDGTYLVDE